MRDEDVRPPDGDGTGDTSQHESSLLNEPQHLTPTTSNAASSASSAPTSRGWLSGVRRPKTSPAPKASVQKRSLLPNDDARGDSALASLNSTACADQTVHHVPSSPTSLRKTPSLPAIIVQDDLSSHPIYNASQCDDLQAG